MAHGSISLRGCVKYIHDPVTTLNFDLKVQFIRWMTWLCVQTSVFYDLWYSHTLFGNWVVRCVAYIHELCMILTFDLNIKNISPWIFSLAKFAHRHRHNKLAYGCITTLVWPWPLTTCGWWGVSLVSFTYSSYLLCSNTYNFELVFKSQLLYLLCFYQIQILQNIFEKIRDMNSFPGERWRRRIIMWMTFFLNIENAFGNGGVHASPCWDFC